MKPTDHIMPNPTDNSWTFDRHDGTHRLDTHHAELTRLIEIAQRSVEGGRLEAAAAQAQIAGMYAWLNHTGLFASPPLEGIPNEIGHRLWPASAVTHPPRRSPPSVVLHVATRVYGTGGHTRMLARWISEDRAAHHRVCITRQGATPVPALLVSELNDQSELRYLDIRRGGLVSRAAALRTVARDADVVVLHTHPHDVVPMIAFASGGDMPPVVYVNHADHVFWLGASIANVVLNLRDSGRVLAIDRRGVDPLRATVMARPLGRIERTLSRTVDEAANGGNYPICLLLGSCYLSRI